MKVCSVSNGEMRGQSIELKTEKERTAFLMTGKRWGFKVVTRTVEVITRRKGVREYITKTYGWRLT